MRAIVQSLTPGVPVIHFGTGTAGLLETLRDAGGDVDRARLADRSRARAGGGSAPTSASRGTSTRPRSSPRPPRSGAGRAAILAQAEGRPGHIFNLGHGILPGTPVDHVRALVDAVHELSQR